MKSNTARAIYTLTQFKRLWMKILPEDKRICRGVLAHRIYVREVVHSLAPENRLVDLKNAIAHSGRLAMWHPQSGPVKGNKAA